MVKKKAPCLVKLKLTKIIRPLATCHRTMSSWTSRQEITIHSIQRKQNGYLVVMLVYITQMLQRVDKINLPAKSLWKKHKYLEWNSSRHINQSFTPKRSQMLNVLFRVNIKATISSKIFQRSSSLRLGINGIHILYPPRMSIQSSTIMKRWQSQPEDQCLLSIKIPAASNSRSVRNTQKQRRSQETFLSTIQNKLPLILSTSVLEMHLFQEPCA